MTRNAKIVAILVGGLVLLVGGALWFALESGEVGVLRTTRPNGTTRDTRVWFAQHGERIWLEAATPDRSWYLDIQRAPTVILELPAGSRSYRAQPQPGPLDHARVRTLLREKYGLRDWWVGLFQDTSHSVAVRLAPAFEGPAPD